MPTAITSIPPALANLQRKVGSADFNRWTKRRYSYYDYVQMPPAGASEVAFFAVPNGQADTYVSTVIKTDEQTNTSKTGQFDKGHFLIDNIRLHIRPFAKNRQPSGINDAANLLSRQWKDLTLLLARLARQGVFSFQVGSKELFDVPQPFLSMPPGFGLDISEHAAATGINGSYAALFQMDPNPVQVYRLDPVQLIEAEQTFKCKILFPNANSPVLTNTVNSATPKVELGLIFEGYLISPLQ